MCSFRADLVAKIEVENVTVIAAFVAAVDSVLVNAAGETFVAANGTFPNGCLIFLRGVILIEEPLKFKGL